MEVYDIYWRCIALLCTIGFTLKGDMEHFTWWTMLMFTFNSYLMCIHKGHLFIVTYTTASIVVSIGVLGMSFMRCHMLVDTAAEMGYLYIIGNGFVHWFPLPILLVFPPKLPPVNYEEQTMMALFLFSIFTLTENAMEIYGCDFHRGIVPILLTIIVGLLMLKYKSSVSILLYAQN